MPDIRLFVNNITINEWDVVIITPKVDVLIKGFIIVSGGQHAKGHGAFGK